jgi:phosphate transport system ATP-binding protein
MLQSSDLRTDVSEEESENDDDGESSPETSEGSMSSSGVQKPEPGTERIRVEDLTAWFGDNEVLHSVEMRIPENDVTAIIGPSGCGKSTFIRCLNRMHEQVSSARMEGRVELDGTDIYADDVDPVLLRRKVGIVFQEPNPFPTMSIRENVLAGLKLTHRLGDVDTEKVVETSLRRAALWDEVNDQLGKSGADLSGGQQQRLCIARSIAVEPDVLLMDEPASALDPVATAKIEDLIDQLREEYTIVVVTHNMQQAARISQWTAFLLMGELVEFGDTDQMFTHPEDSRTEDYITGKFG